MPIIKTARENIRTVLKIATTLFVIPSIVAYIASLVLGPILFFHTSDGLKIAVRGVQELPLLIFMAIPVDLPIHSNMGNLFGVIWMIFVLCIIAAWYSRGGLLKTMKGILKEPILTAKTNFLFLMPLIASALLFSSILIQQFQEARGVQTGSLNFPPQTSPYIILINLAYAPINEELAFRITSIGIPLGLFLLYIYRANPRFTGVGNRFKFLIIAMINPNYAKRSVGYKNVIDQGFLRGISVLEWVLVLITSVVFGLAHYLLGGGWEVGKISTALLAGLVFGVMFVSYGAYAAILLHWYFDYYFTIVSLAESTYGGVFHTFSNLIEVSNYVGGIIVLVVLLLIWAFHFGNCLVNRTLGQHESLG
jgi:hypothetical protein